MAWIEPAAGLRCLQTLDADPNFALPRQSLISFLRSCPALTELPNWLHTQSEWLQILASPPPPLQILRAQSGTYRWNFPLAPPTPDLDDALVTLMPVLAPTLRVLQPAKWSARRIDWLGQLTQLHTLDAFPPASVPPRHWWASCRSCAGWSCYGLSTTR